MLKVLVIPVVKTSRLIYAKVKGNSFAQRIWEIGSSKKEKDNIDTNKIIVCFTIRSSFTSYVMVKINYSILLFQH